MRVASLDTRDTEILNAQESGIGCKAGTIKPVWELTVASQKLALALDLTSDFHAWTKRLDAEN
jgi:hypothetical protein